MSNLENTTIRNYFTFRNFLRFLPLWSVVIVIIEILKQWFYYSRFNLYILPYISFEFLINSFISDIPIFILIAFYATGVSLTARNFIQNVKLTRLSKLLIYVLFFILPIFFYVRLLILTNWELRIGVGFLYSLFVILSGIFIISIRVYRGLFSHINLFYRIITIFFIIFLSGQWQSISSRKYYNRNNEVALKNGTIYPAFSKIYVIGINAPFIIFHSDRDNSNLLINMNEVLYIKTLDENTQYKGDLID